MSHTLIEKLIPLIASTFGIGLIRSMAYGMLSRLISLVVISQDKTSKDFK